MPKSKYVNEYLQINQIDKTDTQSLIKKYTIDFYFELISTGYNHAFIFKNVKILLKYF